MIPPRVVDLPIPTVAPPPPSSVDLLTPAGPGVMDSLGGRSFDQRQKMLEKYGGTAETEAAAPEAEAPEADAPEAAAPEADVPADDAAA